MPTRGLIGFRGECLTDTRGMGVMNTSSTAGTTTTGYILGPPARRLVNDRTGMTTAYALFALQDRGIFFMTAGRGGLRGHGRRPDQQPRERPQRQRCGAKQLTNIRTTAADEKLILVPPKVLTLEYAIEWIDDDELVEVTPNHIRMRKRILAGNMRSVVRGERADAAKKK
jgi:GTP-binding protein